MDEQTDDPDDAVVRLESALERIARLAGQPRAPAGAPMNGSEADGEAHDAPAVPVDEIASRLDQLIDRLRVALASKPG